MELSQDYEVFLTSLFTMLNKINDNDPTFFVVKNVKELFKIDTMPTLQDIPTFIKDPRVITTFNTNEDRVRRTYSYIEIEYNRVINEIWVKEHSTMLRPSIYYALFNTFNFGSVRHQNAFNEHFKESPNPIENSILLLINMHGGFVENPEVLTLSSEVQLNKFSNAATGQCSYSSVDEDKYVVYAICDAVNKDGIIDVPTIIKEGIAHARIQSSQTPSTVFERTHTNIDRMHARELTTKHASTAQHSGKVGEEITFGNLFFEKKYNLDATRLLGVFLCNNWDTIGGKQMDNLLANPHFINFMNEKYDPEHTWTGGDNTPARRKYCGTFNQLLTTATQLLTTTKYCIKTFVSSDLFEFCEIFGKPEISLIDTSCSVFHGTSDGEVITKELTDARNNQFDVMNSSINEKVAKGRKGKKCKSKKCKSKSKRGKGSKKKLKGR